ncbi:Alpha/beta hydrolase family-domain-containing protein [Aspergillus karnatakaensis]|uniref:Alpha/beta hydrolase family-domain-containing protein n=1 Tax=Aspergillus karnatakaensis TaxID=1810916 RepID=UPI003CCE5237
MAASAFIISEHTIDCQYIREYPHATSTQNAPLKLLIKKYTPVNNTSPQPGDVTLIAAPGTGMPKELYEPLWTDLIERSYLDGFGIRAIWSAEPANQGGSGVLNENCLGNEPSWFDHTRDLLHMINHFRDDMPQPIMSVGHSAGATQQIFLSLMHPRLLTSMILLEPWMYDAPRREGNKWIFARAKQPDTWPSRAEALKQSAKRLVSWDPRVIRLWAEYGYRDLPTALHPDSESESLKGTSNEKPVTMTTPLAQETFMYLRPNPNRHKQLGLPDEENDNGSDGPSPPHDPLAVPDMMGGLYPKQRFYRSEGMMAWKGLPHVRPSVLFVTGSKSALSQTGHLKKAAERTGTGIGGSGGIEYDRVKQVELESGHTLPFEKDVIGETAKVVSGWIAREVERWRQDEKRIEEGWKDRPVQDRVGFSAEWKEQMDVALKDLPDRRRGSKL